MQQNQIKSIQKDTIKEYNPDPDKYNCITVDSCNSELM